MQLSKSDIEMCRALRSVVSQGSFTVKGEAIVRVGEIIKWLHQLEKRMESSLQPKPPVRKDLDGPV